MWPGLKIFATKLLVNFPPHLNGFVTVCCENIAVEKLDQPMDCNMFLKKNNHSLFMDMNHIHMKCTAGNKLKK